MTDPWIGRTFEGCRLDSRIAASSSAHLYRATMLGADRPVSVAVVHPGPHRPLPSPGQVMAATWPLRTSPHPCIATVQHAAAYEGQLILVMEDLSGESLQQALRRGPLSPPAVVQLAHDLGAAVAHLHAMDLVHGYLSPHRLLLTPHGVCVLEMGVADTLRKRPPSADIVALGYCLYVAATGRRGPQASVPVSQLAPMLPKWLAELIDDCCSGDPQRRPSDGVGFRARAQAHLAPLPGRVHDSPGLPIAVGEVSSPGASSQGEPESTEDSLATQVSIHPPPSAIIQPKAPEAHPPPVAAPPPATAPSPPLAADEPRAPKAPDVPPSRTSKETPSPAKAMSPERPSQEAPTPTEAVHGSSPTEPTTVAASDPVRSRGPSILLLLAAIALVTTLAIGGVFAGAWWFSQPTKSTSSLPDDGLTTASEAQSTETDPAPEGGAEPDEAPHPFAPSQTYDLTIENGSGRSVHMSCTWPEDSTATDTAGTAPGLEEAMFRADTVTATGVPVGARCEAQDPSSGEAIWTWTATEPPVDQALWSVTIPELASAKSPQPQRRRATAPQAPPPPRPRAVPVPSPAPEVEPAATLRVIAASKRKRKQKGVTVRVDGKKRGEAPVTLAELPLGAYRIEATREDARVACVVTLDEEGLTVAVDPDSGTCSRQ